MFISKTFYFAGVTDPQVALGVVVVAALLEQVCPTLYSSLRGGHSSFRFGQVYINEPHHKYL